LIVVTAPAVRSAKLPIDAGLLLAHHAACGLGERAVDVEAAVVDDLVE